MCVPVVRTLSTNNPSGSFTFGLGVVLWWTVNSLADNFFLFSIGRDRSYTPLPLGPWDNHPYVSHVRDPFCHALPPSRIFMIYNSMVSLVGRVTTHR